MTIQTKANEPFFPVAPFTFLCKMVPTFQTFLWKTSVTIQMKTMGSILSFDAADYASTKNATNIVSYSFSQDWTKLPRDFSGTEDRSCTTGKNDCPPWTASCVKQRGRQRD